MWLTDLCNKIANHAAIIQAHSRAICIENTSNSYLHLCQLAKVCRDLATIKTMWPHVLCQDTKT